MAPVTTSAYQAVCLYYFSIAVSKSIGIDTSSAIVLFTTMVNELYVNISNAFVTFHSSVYSPTYAGVYTIMVTYNWGGAGQVD